MAGKVVLEGHIKVPLSRLRTVELELEEHIRLTRAEEGCLVFEVRQRRDDQTVFDVYEEFVDRRAFDHHQARAGASRWAACTKDVERNYKITGLD